MTYDAFISYSHQDDSRIAKAIQHGLWTFAKPWEALSSLHVFRDETHLPIANNLEETVTGALDSSGNLILIASPQAAKSRWVRLEVERFLSSNSSNAILIVHVSGDLIWDPLLKDFTHGADSAFPDLGRQIFEAEPLYLDLRWATAEMEFSLADPRFREAIASLAATLRKLPKEVLVGQYLQEQLRLRRNQRINLGFRGALGFGGPAALIMLAGTMLVRLDLGSLIGAFVAIGFFGALSCGLGVRGVLAFSIAFAFLTPFYALGSISPYEHSRFETIFLFFVCVVGFVVLGVVAATISRQARAQQGAFAFGLGGFVAATAWLGFPGWRTEGIQTHLLGPWQYERTQIAIVGLLRSQFSTQLAVLVVGATIGGLLFGLQMANDRVELPLQPARPLPARIFARIPHRSWRLILAALAALGAVYWGASLTTPFQLRSVAHELRASGMRSAFSSGLHVNYGFFDPDLFQLILRSRRSLKRMGMTRQATEFSEILNTFAKEYAGYGDKFYDRLDGLVDISIAFVKVGAYEDLRRLLEAAEKTAVSPQPTPNQSFSDQRPLLYDFDRPSALLAVAGAWAVYGDHQRSAALLTSIVEANRIRRTIDAGSVTRIAASLIQAGKTDEAKSIMGAVDVSTSIIDQDVALRLSGAGMWPAQAALSPQKQSGGLMKVIELFREKKASEALVLFNTPGAIDFVNQDVSPALSAAIESGNGSVAFAMLQVADTKSYHDIHTEPRLKLLGAMVAAANKSKDVAILDRIKAELYTREQSYLRGGLRDYDDGQKMVTILKILIAAGDWSTPLRVAESSGQDKYEVYVALANALTTAGRLSEAREMLIHAWGSVYLDSGFSPKNGAPLDEIGELLVKVGDLRGAHFVAEDYGFGSSESAKLAKRYSLYCSILESADPTLIQKE